MPVPVTKVLHLKSAVTALPDGTVIGFDPLVDDPSLFSTYLPVPEEPGAHVVLLDAETVLMSAAAPRTRELFEGRGASRVEAQGQPQPAARVADGQAHEDPVLDELDVDPQAEHRGVPVAAAGQIRDRELDVMDAGQVRHDFDPFAVVGSSELLE